ncbi:MAG: glycosyltransferase [Anaerolineales bacterium]|nr:glycosyltransferase [Anaerolineales bacterium]
MNAPTPEITFILVIGEQRQRGVECLRSLLGQSQVERMEILIVDSSPAGTPDLAGSQHPAVRVLRLPPETPFGQQRAAGVHQAQAPLVAFIEEHCLVLPGYAEALLESYQGAWAGVCGEMLNWNACEGFSDAIYLMGFAPWHPGHQSEVEMEQLVVNNSSYRRDLLLAFGPDLPHLLLAEPVLQWKLQTGGQRLCLQPRARFAHTHETSPMGLVAYFHWHRAFGYWRAREFGWTASKRWLHVLAAPAIPWLRLARLGTYLLRHSPARLWSFLIHSPIMLLAQSAAACGQAAGLLFGLGSSEARFTHFELNGSRM